MSAFRRMASLRTPDEFRAYAASIGAQIALDDELQSGPDAPLAAPLDFDGFTIGNRFAILPMEGWDAQPGGAPSELTLRRWRRFGASGAKLIWGGEAAAVRADGRANPNQLLATRDNLPGLVALREALVTEHEKLIGPSGDLLVGLQLTHSGRFARPNDKKRLEPRILYQHPVLGPKFSLPADYPVLSDDDIDRLTGDFIAAARVAREAGYAFVDVKHCHGYLGHEFLSAVDRPGRYGGSFENRTRFLRAIVEGIRAEAPGLKIGVRLSAVDWLPYRARAGDSIGEPEPLAPGMTNYPYAFGGDGSGAGVDLTEPCKFLDLLAALDIRLVCVTVGSPYYNPHRQRPAYFPPSDGYQPPEDPLVGVACQLDITAQLKRHRSELIVVGSGYSYLQEWLPNVAQAELRAGRVDSIGLGRMVLSYPELPADVLAGRTLKRKAICRTFSDCTTGPRNGLVSGCFPLDEFYKNHPDAEQLARLKADH